MDNLTVKFKLDNIEIDAVFEEGFNVFPGNSSTGKTRAFKAIWFYCRNEQVNCKYIDYSNYEDINWSNLKGFDILLLDDADLYMEHVNYRELAKNNKVVVADVKQVRYTINIDIKQRSIYMEEDKVMIR